MTTNSNWQETLANILETAPEHKQALIRAYLVGYMTALEGVKHDEEDHV